MNKQNPQSYNGLLNKNAFECVLVNYCVWLPFYILGRVFKKICGYLGDLFVVVFCCTLFGVTLLELGSLTNPIHQSMFFETAH